MKYALALLPSERARKQLRLIVSTFSKGFANYEAPLKMIHPKNQFIELISWDSGFNIVRKEYVKYRCSKFQFSPIDMRTTKVSLRNPRNNLATISLDFDEGSEILRKWVLALTDELNVIRTTIFNPVLPIALFMRDLSPQENLNTLGVVKKINQESIDIIKDIRIEFNEVALISITGGEYQIVKKFLTSDSIS